MRTNQMAPLSPELTLANARGHSIACKRDKNPGNIIKPNPGSRQIPIKKKKKEEKNQLKTTLFFSLSLSKSLGFFNRHK